MKKLNAQEYIAFLRNRCDMGKSEKLRQSDTVQREKQYLESLGIPSDTSALYLSYANLLNESADILAKKIVKALKKLSLDIQKMPMIGVLPTEDFNAWATAAPNGDPICILDDSLFSTLMAFSWCLSEALISPKNPNVKPDYAKCSLGAIAACERLIYGGYKPAEQYLSSIDFKVDESWYVFGGFFASAIESFVIAHEFAHHIKGHVSPLQMYELQKHGNQQAISVYNRTQLNEFEADCVGADIFLAIEFDLYTPSIMCAPLVFFDYLSFAEKFLLKNSSSLTHPPAHERKKRLMTYIWDNIPQNARLFYKNTNPFWQGIELVQTTRHL